MPAVLIARLSLVVGSRTEIIMTIQMMLMKMVTKLVSYFIFLNRLIIQANGKLKGFELGCRFFL